MIRFACAAAIAITLSGAGAARAQPAPGSEQPTEPPATPDPGTPPAPAPEATPEAAPAPEGTPAEEGTVAGNATTARARDANAADSLVESDVQPTLSVVRTDDIMVLVGGLVQVHSAPYVGDDALIENGDPATRAGFRLRRARLGFEGRFKSPLRIELVIDLLEADEDEGTVSDAKLHYDWRPELTFSLGVGKVAFSRGSLESSRRLPVIERPLAVTEIAPDRRLGFDLEGRVLGGRLAYVVGLANGSEGFSDGNEFGGFLAGGRLQYFLLGEPKGLDVVDGVAIGASGFYEDAPATNGFAAAADVTGNFAGATLVVEGLCDSRKPDDSPDVAPTIADEITRCGGYVTGLYDLLQVPIPLQPAARLEWLDDNTDVEDAGDVWQLSAGVNSMLIDPNLRAQLHYISRIERHGPSRPNDSLVLSFTGVF